MFRDRRHAGQLLALRLQHLREEHPVVLGLPRGGVIVAAEIARALNAPLDVLIVRKLGAPHQPELALGAVTGSRDPHVVLNEDIVRLVGVDQSFIDRAVAEQVQEMQRREALYREGRNALELRGRTVIVVDDGIATGATVRAGLQAIRRHQPRRLILAVSVAPPDALDFLRSEVDQIVCLHSPPDFAAVGAFYDDFAQTTDEEVIAVLHEQQTK